MKVPQALLAARAVGPVVILVASACVGAPPAATGPSASAAEVPQRGGRIVAAGGIDVQTLNPMLAAEVTSTFAAGLIYASLYAVDPKTGELSPDLGSWTVSADGLTYRWTIKASASWSDGKPIVGQDYLTAVKAVARSKVTVRKPNFQEVAGFAEYRDGIANAISGVTLDPTDPKKFAVRFVRAFCPALANAFGQSAGPLPTQVFGKYVVDDDVTKNVDAAPENVAPPVASGPFKFRESRKGELVTLDRNETYFKGAPFVDQFVFRVTGVGAQVGLVKSGDANFTRGVQQSDLTELRGHDDLVLHRYPVNGYTFIGWNTRSATAPALADKRVRQALAYALDMDAVVRSVLLGEGARAVAHHPPTSWAYPDRRTLDPYPFDRAKAEDLLHQAGYAKGADGLYAKDGKALAFTILAPSAGQASWDGLLETAVEQYRALGVKASPEHAPFQAVTDRLDTGNLEAWILGWSLGLDPDPYSIWHSSQIPDAATKKPGFNSGGFTAPGLDRAIEEGRTPANGDCSQAARKKSYETVDRILNDEQPYNFGFAANQFVLTSKSLRGVDPGTYAIFWNVERWWIKP